MTCITTSCSYNIGSELQLLATSTEVFVFDSSLTLTLALTLDCNKGSLLRASGLVDLQSIILRKFENPCEGKKSWLLRNIEHWHLESHVLQI